MFQFQFCSQNLDFLRSESTMFFCPSGKMFYSTSPSKIKEDLEKNCQCPCCDKFELSRPDLGCSLGAAGEVLRDDFNADWACKVIMIDHWSK